MNGAALSDLAVGPLGAMRASDLVRDGRIVTSGSAPTPSKPAGARGNPASANDVEGTFEAVAVRAADGEVAPW